MMLGQVIAVGALAAAMVTGDTVAPTTPLGVHQIGTEQGQAVYGWDASTDNVGVSWYSIKLDGSQVRRDTKLTRQVRVYDLYLYCHALPGHSYTLQIEAVDAAGNHSAPSQGVVITVA
ncbi:hypothetical protein [Kutzneria sp. NPDC052558]|uniref:hypothetical protein n=1 Tax=Kutzneria sp. NPDC052558 TaxID=3364121 RepID=UPI0037CAD5D9